MRINKLQLDGATDADSMDILFVLFVICSFEQKSSSSLFAILFVFALRHYSGKAIRKTINTKKHQFATE